MIASVGRLDPLRPPDECQSRNPSSVASRTRLAGVRNMSWASLVCAVERRQGGESALGRASNIGLDAQVVLEIVWNVYEGA